MFHKNAIKKLILYTFLSFLVIGILLFNPMLSSFFNVKDAIMILICVCLVHSNCENRMLLKSLSTKYGNSEQMLRKICKHCPDLISYRDFKHKYVVVNDAMLNFLGKSEEEIISKSEEDVLPKEIMPIVKKHSETVLKNAKSVSFKLCLTKDGKKRYFDTFLTPMIDDGDVVGILNISREITKEEELKTVVLQKQFYMTSILDNLPFIAFLKDLDGNIVGANKRLEELSGIECKNLVGMRPIDVFGDKDVCAFSYIRDEEIIKTKKSIVQEHKFNLSNTGEAWYRIEKAPIVSKDGAVRGITVFVKNIEQEKIIETHKETFVATLTHDLKTPTIAQIRALELLLNGTFGPLNEAQNEITVQTLESCKFMLSMISDVLSTYKYENGDARLINQEFNLFSLAHECCSELMNLASDKKQQIKLKSRSKASPVVFGDKTQLKRVIMNLVSNSISHGYENTDINVVIEETKDGIVFTSNNDSPTIPDDILDKVFDKYVSGAAKFNKVGTGLGLYLSQRIVSAHLGSMIASSKDNHTSFGFVIPHSKKAKEILLVK